MGYHPVTPFGRPVESVREVLSARQSANRSGYPTPTAAPCPLDKWQILRDLTTARTAFGLSDRDLTVLQALISFHPGAQLDPSAPLVVHPSNASICERAHGMAASTMRRHLAKLVESGLLIRRDSPNGKRYARRMAGQKVAFGFDLRPLLLRASEIAEAAETTRRAEEELRALRDTVSLLRRDLAGLAALGRSEQPQVGQWDALDDLAQLSARHLRRKLDHGSLRAMEADLRRALEQALALLEPETEEVSTSPAQNEQHQQSSQKDLSDSEPDAEVKRDENAERTATTTGNPDESDCTDTHPPVASPETSRKASATPQSLRPGTVAPPPPLRLVLDSCPEISGFSAAPISDWPTLIRSADQIRPMTGISETAWEDAKRIMGPVQASVTLAAMLERFGEIRNPGGYLRHLTSQARAGAFSATRMVMALSRRAA
ncbi:plasmid replication protein RepC [Maritimibacter alkaliphilus]|uniref:plasmid replication protein RepC n=1 Tax=Maritimibacter alkaliphilus TaxID=404236 RepID=UPI001C98004B|nr:plasmid replication protein RepC [Maritimibacter alkaliphilus]MBY6092318.1 replication initiation protein [Maritimibacter alkaliphilus]